MSAFYYTAHLSLTLLYTPTRRAWYYGTGTLQCCGSGAFLSPGFRSGPGISFLRILDLGSRITNPMLWELRQNFLGKNALNLCQFPQIFSVQKINKVGHQIFPHTLFNVVESGIRDWGRENIWIRDKHPGSATLLLSKWNASLVPWPPSWGRWSPASGRRRAGWPPLTLHTRPQTF